MNEYLLTDPAAAFDYVAPQRVVSLVPSVTASLFDLGVSQALVGVSDYCTYPAGQVEKLARVGGPKDARVADIVALKPDLVIANREENSREIVESLASAGITVWLTFPTSVQASVNDLWTIANLFRNDLAMQQVDYLERAVEWAERAGESQPALRYFCPIWEDGLGTGGLETGGHWWMTFNANTYPNDVLRIFNGQNIFGSRERRYPLLADLDQATPEDADERDTRYPRVNQAEIIDAQPELILLPSEPFAYGQADCDRFAEIFAATPAAQTGQIYTIDGTLITWHGTRLARALEELPDIFR
jgi:iron complex transport system substrate-binding protein